ncbi:MAG: PQQ-binding-like beta-propeller repeat protein, partial [Planctomycetota bacterium]
MFRIVVVRRSLPILLTTVVLWGSSERLIAAEESWWQFRGPHGNGHATATDLPLEWDESDNVVWKTAIHDRGWSSPVVWGSQVWLTTATRDGRQLFAVCIDKDSGKVVHDVHVFDVENPMRISNENTYATPTSAIEEGRVFVHFGTYGTACLDTETGREIWHRRDVNCDHEAGAGPASSPTLIDGKLIVHVDGRDAQYIVALDRGAGDTLWKTPRSVDFTNVPLNQRKEYCMPIVIPRAGGGAQIV